MRDAQHISEAYRPLASLVAIDPELLPTGTPPSYIFHYIDIASATQGRLLLPDDGIEYRNAPSRARRVLRDGDVIMSTVRPNLKAFAYCRLPPGNFIASTGFAVLRAKEGTDPRFILYSILSDDVTRQLERFVVGSNYPAINSSDVKRLLVPNLSPHEQERIGEIIGAVDEAIEQTEALIAKTQQIKAGLMQDLFTRGVTADGQLRPPREEAPQLYKESPLGWIPREWEVAPIGYVFEIQLGKMLNKQAKTGRFSAPYVGNRAAQWDHIDINALEEMDFYPTERSKFRLLPGDILVCEGGEVGRTAMWRGELDECFYQKALHRLRPNNGRAYNGYMLRFMRFACEVGFFRVFTSQSSIAHLTREKLARVLMLVPVISEQEHIAARFDSIDEELEVIFADIAKLRQAKFGLMQDLLTGRVQVAPKPAPHSSPQPSPRGRGQGRLLGRLRRMSEYLHVKKPFLQH
ncbi:MAG: restriction endonuclease subunit S [Candidatus Competibacteraceae bacterium]